MVLQPWPSQQPLRQADRSQKSVLLRVENCADELELLADRPILLGRDSTSSDCWAIDLSEFGAQERGVSYQHARLIDHPEGVIVVDAGSLNGTYLNAQKLVPHTPHQLKDGDYLHLGMLMIKVSLP